MSFASIPKSEDILRAIHHVVGQSDRGHTIGLHEPDFSGTQAWAYVKDCLDTGWVSTAGIWVSRFEKELCTVTGAKHAIAVSNGTVALRLALHVIGVKPGDEVVLPPLSFVATANAIAHLGAVPHFVDVENSSLGLSPTALNAQLEKVTERKDGVLLNRETGRRIVAILPVHVFGFPAQIIELRKVADAWQLPLVEDAAEALGSWREDIHCGLFGAVGTLSFNGNKLITTGGGGALLTNNDEIAKNARHLSTTAKQQHPWSFHHDAVGWNDRMPNLNAALGVAQIEDLNRRLKIKQKLAKEYIQAFSKLDGIEVLPEPPGCKSNYWMVTLRFTTPDPGAANAQRLRLLEKAHETGLLLRPIWSSLNELPMYTSCPAGPLLVAEDQAPRLINIPSSPQLHNEWGRT
ncbi:putative aminotransferase (degT family) protein [Synechococcus sp. BL107]|uniref:LegC family aminotransferase n=1 Tax=Synechococcus sp. BL107 TaxID=313625 RepID=UPI0000E53BDC|nr:LegC family aminotransferase [Synechococcus sp. BL107]EAU71138.1 putative aminotransferase (degT family) protein [Synechococcus sp. BL107]